jgi:hypothetical protein
MVVGQQKLNGLEFQTNLNTKLISKRICGENTRAPLSTESKEHSKLCDKCIPVSVRLIKNVVSLRPCDLKFSKLKFKFSNSKLKFSDRIVVNLRNATVLRGSLVNEN